MSKPNLKKLYVIILGLVLLLNGCSLFGGYSISGTLTDSSDGDPIGGIRIQYTGKAAGKVTSGKDGKFVIPRARGITTIKPISTDYSFEPKEYTVKQATTGLKFRGTSQLVLNIVEQGAGKVNPYPEKQRYDYGEKVTLTPEPDNAGASFSHWTGSVDGDEDPLIITMNASKSITAYFIETDQAVTFADTNLELAVRDALGKPSGLITTEDVKSITTLDASIRPIESLEGLEYLANLTSLNLEVTDIEDIQPIADLTQLEELNLGFNSITSIDALTNLTSLNQLRLNDNKLNDIDSLFWSSVKNLQVLDLSNNQLRKIDNLYKLKKLTTLNLSKNQINDISPLAQMTTLRELNLSSNQIVNLDENLKSLTNLEVLDLQKNKITDISEMTWLWSTGLRELNLSHNTITDLQPLSNMENLERLFLKDIEVTDVSDLRFLPKILELDLSHNLIDDLTGIGELTTLEMLYLHNNLLTTISPLINLTNLEKITLMSNDDLNLSQGSPADTIIKALIANGCSVLYDYYQNDAPILEEIGPKTIYECDHLIIPLKARDPNGDELTYRVEGDQEVLDFFDPATAIFDWETGYEDAGSYDIYFFVSDGDIEISEEVLIDVINVNRPPRFTNLTDMSVDENSTIEFTLEAVDDDGQEMTFGADLPELSQFESPPTFTAETGEFSWTPGYEDSGVYEFTFMVDDSEDTVSQMITITVNHINRAPILEEIAEQVVMETQTVEFTIEATELDVEDTLAYSISSTTEWLESFFDPDTLEFSWTTDYDDAGNYVVTVIVDDGTTTVTQDVSIIVEDSDRPPVLDMIEDKTVDEYDELTFTINATDPDGDHITYSMNPPLDGATLDPETGLFSWIPDIDDKDDSPHYVTFTATSQSLTDTQEVQIVIRNVEFAPELPVIGPQVVDENQQVLIELNAIDKDRDELDYSATSDTLDLTDKWDSNTHIFEWTPGYDDSGIYRVTFTVTDNKETPVSEEVVITVNHVNRPPVLDPIGEQTIEEESTLEFTVSATELDVQDTLTYWVTSETPGLSNFFDPDTQTFSWPTTYDDEGVYTVNFVVSDGTVEVSEQVQITVTKLDRPPVLAEIGSQEAYDNELLTFNISATDLDDDPITYSMSPIIDGATLDPETGEFDWTPTNAQISGSPYEVVFTAAADGVTDTETVEITVVDINHPHVIKVNGTTRIFEGQTLNLQVSYTDVDEDVLNVVINGTLASHYNDDSEAGVKGFVWETGYTDHGIYWADIRVNDGAITEDVVHNLEVEVIDVDAAPVINPLSDLDYDRDLIEDPISFMVEATDPDGDIVSLSVAGLPSGVLPGDVFNPDTGVFNWRPQSSHIGRHTLNFIAIANGKQTTEQVVITVYGPKLVLTNINISANQIELGIGDESLLTVRVDVQNLGNKAAPGDTAVVWGIYTRTDEFIGTAYSSTLGSDLTPSGTRRLVLTIPDTSVLPNVPNIDDIFSNFGGSYSYGDYKVGLEITDEKVGGPLYTGIDFTLIPEQLELTVNIVGDSGASGTVSRSPDQETYDVNSDVILTAEPDEGCVFDGWEDGGGQFSTDPQITVSLTTDRTIVARFKRLPFPTGSRLAFISTRDNTYGEIYTMERDGTINRLTTNTIKERNLRWSPNGQKIVFEGESAGKKYVYVVDVMTKVVSRLTTIYADEEAPSWSPDGSQIVFSSEKYGNKDIFKIDANGTNLAELTKYNSLDETQPIWYDNKIVFVCEGNLFITDTNGGSRDQMTSGIFVSNPRWSADGDKIALDGQDGNIHIVDFTGPSENPYVSWDFYSLSGSGGMDKSAAWNPDTGELAFVSLQGGTGEIYLGDVSGFVTRLTVNGSDDIEPSWNGTGTIIAFTSDRDGNKELYALDLSNDPPVLYRLTKNGASDSEPVWAP